MKVSGGRRIIRSVTSSFSLLVSFLNKIFDFRYSRMDYLSLRRMVLIFPMYRTMQTLLVDQMLMPLKCTLFQPYRQSRMMLIFLPVEYSQIFGF